MGNLLSLAIYSKAGNRAGLVFRKNNNVLYRITTIENARSLVGQLNAYGNELIDQRATPKYILEIVCPRNRKRVLEIGIHNKQASLEVCELNGELTRCCFKWEGAVEELTDAFKNRSSPFY